MFNDNDSDVAYSTLTGKRHAEGFDSDKVLVVEVLDDTGVDAAHFDTDVGDLLLDGKLSFAISLIPSSLPLKFSSNNLFLSDIIEEDFSRNLLEEIDNEVFDDDNDDVYEQ